MGKRVTAKEDEGRGRKKKRNEMVSSGEGSKRYDVLNFHIMGHDGRSRGGGRETRKLRSSSPKRSRGSPAEELVLYGRGLAVTRLGQ